MVSWVEPSNSSLTHNTQCSSRQASSLMPITHLAHLPTHLTPGTHRLFCVFKVSYGLPLSLCCYLIFLSLPQSLSFLFLKFHIWVKSYDICLSLIDLIPFSIIQSSSIHVVANGKRARFHSFGLASIIPYIYTTSFLSIHLSMDI